MDTRISNFEMSSAWFITASEFGFYDFMFLCVYIFYILMARRREKNELNERIILYNIL
jgi:hypothetical protein